MTAKPFFATLLFTAASFASAADMDDAPEAANRGRAPTLDMPAEPHVIWKFSADGHGIDHGAACDGLVFVSEQSRSVNAFRAADGSAVWKYLLKSEYVSGLVCSRDADCEAVIVSTYEGLTALDRKTGELLWSAGVALGVGEAVVWDERIYAAGYDGFARAFDLKTGKELWSHDFLKDAPPDPPGFDGKSARLGDRPARPGPASCDGKTVFFSVFDQCRTIALDCETGAREWAFNTQGWMYGRPTITTTTVLVGSQDDWLYCIDKDMGIERWKFKTGARIEASPAVHDDKVYFGSCDGSVYCLNHDMGGQIWKTEIEKGARFHGAIYEQPLVGASLVYLASLDGDLYAFDPAKGDIRWRMRPSADSEIDDSFTDGERIFVCTRMSGEKKGEEAVFAVGPAGR